MQQNTVLGKVAALRQLGLEFVHHLHEDKDKHSGDISSGFSSRESLSLKANIIKEVNQAPLSQRMVKELMQDITSKGIERYCI